MKKTVSVIALLSVLAAYGFSADTEKKTTAPVNKNAAVKEVPKDLKVVMPETVKPAGVKAAEAVLEDFEAEPFTVKASSYIGDASGMEETVEDKILLVQDGKKFKTGKKSAKLAYSQNPANEKKFAQITLSSENVMALNNAVSFYVFVEKGKGSIAINLFDSKWKKWTSQTINADKSEWVQITVKDSEFVSDTREGKWANINKAQLIIKGSGVFYFDNVKFVKEAK
ncbi:MAG: hypothetical protein A2452_03115 [Candidatus Firestonebacteria bacterium RIFOXYC2_FULL_39_67]|nr:MAG: hypothetical protein A2536_02530 [Candidatus Firestonebacteria bacterium RIFOXYD2_FULL_39_29]OGF55442.1 MAG: hypothetical protein A2452_03115 [Candidatus Firestonebacteria bacterium RIFOXYC2_FULL_39_67]OGF57719.1 MAG: hypothetical protein A2497_00460 [Candidatus Firestonebacteria bacterium RifOxyC12_full_39_7]